MPEGRLGIERKEKKIKPHLRYLHERKKRESKMCSARVKHKSLKLSRVDEHGDSEKMEEGGGKILPF